MKKLAIRVDANQYIGLGHFFRCLFLAESLRNMGVSVRFFMLESSMDDRIRFFLDKKGFPYSAVSRNGAPWTGFFPDSQKALKGYDSVLVDLLIPDYDDKDLISNPGFISQNVSGTLETLLETGRSVFALSDQYDRMALNADVIINSCPKQKRAWYDERHSIYLLGPSYYILGSSYKQFLSRPKHFVCNEPKVVIFCGGNDHRGFLKMLLEVLIPYLKSIRLEVILGAATPDGEERAREFKSLGIRPRFLLLDLAPVLFDADFVVSTSGNTLFDLAALGIPAAAVSTRGRQKITAQFFQEMGSCVYLGYERREIESKLKMVMAEILFSRAKLEEMSCRGREIIDGLGASRIVQTILQFV